MMQTCFFSNILAVQFSEQVVFIFMNTIYKTSTTGHTFIHILEKLADHGQIAYTLIC